MVKTIDITRALAIEGWMSEPELVWLAEQAIEHRCIVEIGSYLGRSTRAMLDHTEGIVFAVDDWKGPRDVYMSKEEREGLFKKFLDNVGFEFANSDWHKEKCHIISGDHRFFELSACLRGLVPDMVFIDGSHEYLDVKRDIEIWWQKLAKGGLLCGHDINMPDVRKAVIELLDDEVEVVDNTSIWWWVKI